MTIVIEVCAVVITLVFIVIAIFLVNALIQVRKTAAQAEQFLKTLNHEAEVLKQISESISSFTGKMGSTWFKIGSWAFSAASKFIKDRKASQQQQ